MKLILTTITALLLGLSHSLYANTLSQTETQIVNHVDQANPQALQLLKKITNINSGTMNFAGVKQVGDILAAELETLGFTTRWIDGTPFNRSGHLLASYSGAPAGPKILMIGHLDTVFSKDSKIQQYIELKDNLVKGPGLIDMKGGDVIIIEALRALKAAGQLNKLNIQVVMTGDEEKRGEPMDLASQVLIDSAKWADIALGFESGDGDFTTAVVSRRGYTGWQLNVSAKPAHSSQIFREDIGYGAIYETARILNEFRVQLSGEENLTFNPGLILGGTEAELNSNTSNGNAFGKQNVIAKTTKVSGDLRTLSLPQLAKAQQAMQKIVAAHLNQTDATIAFEPGYPPLEPSKGNFRLLTIFDQVSQELGFGKVSAVDPKRAGAADISFTAGHVKMAMDGLGLMGHSAHTDDETADISTLSKQTKRAALLMYRLIDEPVK